MRYLVGSQMGLFAVPFVVLVGVAYVWVMERLLGRKSEIVKQTETPSVKKAA
jgi:uncharacterized membrane protein